MDVGAADPDDQQIRNIRDFLVDQNLSERFDCIFNKNTESERRRFGNIDIQRIYASPPYHFGKTL